MVAGWRRLARRRSERGAAAVEFALILPVLVLLLGAIIDFGFIFSQQIALNNATRDAARLGVVKPLSPGVPLSVARIQQAARNSMGGGVGMNPAGVTVAVTRSDTTTPSATAPCSGSAQGDTLNVTTTYPSSPPFPVPFMGTIVLSSKGVFRCEYT